MEGYGSSFVSHDTTCPCTLHLTDDKTDRQAGWLAVYAGCIPMQALPLFWFSFSFFVPIFRLSLSFVSFSNFFLLMICAANKKTEWEKVCLCVWCMCAWMHVPAWMGLSE